MEYSAVHVNDLAIDGGPAVRLRPFAAWPVFGDNETRIVSEILRSGKVNYWTGPHGKAFEAEFAWFCGVRHGIALSNGTLALEAALRALRIGPGDEVIVPPRTFYATATTVLHAGAVPVFADVDPDSQTLTAETVAPHVTPRTKAIMAVHLAGRPCEMDGLMDLAGEHGLYVIEDCAQAHGAAYRGRPVGSLGHVAAFSFCQEKIMTTGGEGGMLVTNDDSTYERAWSYKEHGKSRQLAQADHDGTAFRWLHTGVGTNGRMTEIQAALGRYQLGLLPQWHERRAHNARRLREGLGDVPGLRIPAVPRHIQHAWYKFYAFIQPEALRSGWTRDRIIEAVGAEGVPCFSGSCPEIYREGGLRELGVAPERRLPNAQRLGETSLMFVVHPTLDDSDMDATVAAVAKVMLQAVR